MKNRRAGCPIPRDRVRQAAHDRFSLAIPDWQATSKTYFFRWPRPSLLQRARGATRRVVRAFIFLYLGSSIRSFVCYRRSRRVPFIISTLETCVTTLHLVYTLPVNVREEGPMRTWVSEARGIFRARNYALRLRPPRFPKTRRRSNTSRDHRQTQILDTPGHFKLAIILFNLRDRRHALSRDWSRV